MVHGRDGVSGVREGCEGIGKVMVVNGTETARYLLVYFS